MTVALDDIGGWPGVLSAVFARQDLSASTVSAALGAIFDGGVDPVIIAGFAAGLRTKGETVEEMCGLVDAMRTHGETVVTDLPVIDTCGTGGDRLGTVNVSTTAALIVAGAGVPVCKHGGRAASSVSGSADVLEALGVAIELGPTGVARCLELAGIGFCFAPRFHPAMRHVAPVRRTLGVPTVFNFLGPLTNPARATRQVIGISDPSMAEKLLGVLEATGSAHAMVFHGHDGLDELSVSGRSTIHELRRGPDGTVTTTVTELDPSSLGLESHDPSTLRGGEPDYNADRVRATLGGEEGPQREIAILNAAAAFVVAGRSADLAGGVALAAKSIDDGSALAALDRLIAVSCESAELGLI
jgi:anthranilate phosphoribosyltransferase